ncbi:hypothetical protein KBY85_15330 [Cyanobium sp. BA5m-10]|uniref:phage major capsid protein n=1 Tax=Cyanobium sp. BA5m-10 TaxID=2823705 RepID=UPI0020CD8D1D|nr:hypothetical protein [Cyanobium sp. BA5m-10]MCP9905496.1 hypothetical protein [Cyanobium sp. BA5m-10]
MANPETLLRLQPLTGAAATANETDRTIELTVATETPINDLVLRCQPGSVEFGPAPVPVLLNHTNSTAEMAGRLVSIRFERGQLIAVAQFTDAPAADAGWQLARSGCAVSVGATYQQDAIALGRNTAPDTVTKWRLREASLVAVGADPMSTTRSADFHNKQEETPVTMTIDSNNEQTLDKIERARTVAILDCARKLSVSDDLAHRLIEDGVELSEARMALIDARSAEERKTPAQSRSEIMPVNQESQLAQSISRAMSGERLAEPLWLQLRREGVPGRNSADVFRSWLQGRRDATISRGMHSTSDAPALLLGAGDRMLQAQFAVAAGGVLAAADVRSLNDYRPASIIDVGKVGSAKKILEGGEVKFSTIAESSASYKPNRWGDGLSVSPEALANDDLDGLRQAISELGAAALDAEKSELVYLLEGSSLGATAADGAALFHSSHSNVISSGPLGIDKIGAAVALLRGQKTVGGRHIDQQPGVILCGLQAEMTVRQLLSDTVTPNTPANVNPFQGLTIEVDPRIGDTYLYLISAGPRKPLELGRLYAAPLVSDEVHFDTGSYRIKAEHAFGVAVSEFRAIVRMKLAA